MLRRRQVAEGARVDLGMAFTSVCLTLLLQGAAVWASGATPPAAAGAAAGAAHPEAAAAAANGTAAHAAAETGTVGARGGGDMGQHGAHKCTNVKLFSECRVHCEYVVEGKGAYFIFTDGEDGVPCKTRTLDGQVLSGSCHQGLCNVKCGQEQAGAAVAAGTVVAGAPTLAPAAAAATGAAGHAAAAAASVAPAHAAASPAHAAAAKHKKA